MSEPWYVAGDNELDADDRDSRIEDLGCRNVAIIVNQGQPTKSSITSFPLFTLEQWEGPSPVSANGSSSLRVPQSLLLRHPAAASSRLQPRWWSRWGLLQQVCGLPSATDHWQAPPSPPRPRPALDCGLPLRADNWSRRELRRTLLLL